MSENPFDKLRAGRADCPSDLLLDRMQAGELSTQQAASISAHLASCVACAKHLRNSSFSALSAKDPATLLAGIRTRLDVTPKTPRWKRLLHRPFSNTRGRPAPLLAPLLALSAAAALAVLVVQGDPFGKSDDDSALRPLGVRSKGGLALYVHRFTAHGSEEVRSGTQLSPGDRLRFMVDLPQEGYTAVVGVEQNGNLYYAWPLADAKAAPLQPPGLRQILPGAVLLDDSLGQETLYLVFCPRAVGAPANRCQSRGPQAAPACPSGCMLTSFILKKSRAR